MGLIKRLGSEEPAPPWGLISAIGYIVGAFACVILGTALASAFLGNAPTTFIVGYSVGMVAIALVVTVTRNRTPQDGQALRTDAASTRFPLPIILLLSIGVAIAIDLLSLAITGSGWPTPELLGFFDTTGATGGAAIRMFDVGIAAWGLAILFMVVLQPASEELVFRGIAFPALRSGLGIWGGYLMTAVFYAVFHLLAYAPPGAGGNSALAWVSIGVPFLSGLYLTGVRAYTGSTRAAVVAHAGLGLFLVLRTLLFAG